MAEWTPEAARARMDAARVDYATYIRQSRIHYGQMDAAASQQLREGFVAEQRYLVWRNDQAVADLTAALDVLVTARAEAEALAAVLTHYVNNCPRCHGRGVTAYNSVYEHGIQYMEPAECRTCAWARAALTAATPAGTGQEEGVRS